MLTKDVATQLMNETGEFPPHEGEPPMKIGSSKPHNVAATFARPHPPNVYDSK